MEEARDLLRRGILKGMFSDSKDNELPKYIWSVDDDGEVYEAKVSPGSNSYKGYRLEEEDAMRDTVLKEWKARNQAN